MNISNDNRYLVGLFYFALASLACWLPFLAIRYKLKRPLAIPSALLVTLSVALFEIVLYVLVTGRPAAVPPVVAAFIGFDTLRRASREDDARPRTD